MPPSIDILPFVRSLAALLWLFIVIHNFFNGVRVAIGRGGRHDPLFALIWFAAFHQLGYGGRWLFSLSADPKPGADATSLLGLNVIGIMIAIGCVQQRVKMIGWKL